MKTFNLSLICKTMRFLNSSVQFLRNFSKNKKYKNLKIFEYILK